MASPGNPNPPAGASFDMHNFYTASINPPIFDTNAATTSLSQSHLLQSQSPSPSASSPPPPTSHFSYFHDFAPHFNLPPPHHDFGGAHPLMSMSYSPTSPAEFCNIPNWNNPNRHGAHLMALLNPPPTPETHNQIQPTATAHDLLIRKTETGMPSSKVPKGRRLIGDRLAYDIDVRLPGEVQPQLKVSPITKYNSDPKLVLGRQIAASKLYICYGLRNGAIRVINLHTGSKSLLKGEFAQVTDMAFFAEDVHLLASVGLDGHVCVWKIIEYQENEVESRITGRMVVAIQINAERKPIHPRVCWHCQKQEVLVVGIGRHVLKIDTTKVGGGEACRVEKLITGVKLVGSHNGEVTDLSMCQSAFLVSASVDGTVKVWDDKKLQPIVVLQPHNGHPVNTATFLAAPNKPDHFVLVTGGPLNREVKIWVSPNNGTMWHCTQMLELMCSETPVEEAFFNQATALPLAGLLVLANAKRKAMYVVHLEYGPSAILTQMDYIAEFSVTMPILSVTGTSEILQNGEHNVKIFCVQTQAIQQHDLFLTQCLPPPMENIKDDHSEPSAKELGDIDHSSNKKVGAFEASSLPEASVQENSLHTMTCPGIDAAPELVNQSSISSPTAPSPLPLIPKFSEMPSSFRSPLSSLDHGLSARVLSSGIIFGDLSIDSQGNVDRNFSEGASFDTHSRNNNTKVSEDDFKNAAHLVTPAEILMANPVSDVKHVAEPPTGDAERKSQDTVNSNESRNIDVEEKIVDESGVKPKDDVESRSPKLSSFLEGADIKIDFSRTLNSLSWDSGQTSIVKDTSQFNETDETQTIGRQLTADEAPQSVNDDVSRKQNEKGAQELSSPLPQPSDKSNEPCVSTNAPAESAFAPQMLSMQESLNQLVAMQKEMQKQMAGMVANPVTKEVKRLEATLGRNVEKMIKSYADALSLRFQEESTKQNKAMRECVDHLTNMIKNCSNKDICLGIEKAIKKEMTSLGKSVAQEVTTSIEKTISASIAESFQRGVGDKAVNQLEKSVSSKLEVTVARQIQVQFQTSGKQALQETLKSSLEASVIPAFEKSCRSMFEQVDATFHKGIADHTSAAQQHFGASHAPLAVALQDAINSASSVTQTLSSEILDGQRKLLALAATGTNSTNPLVNQLSTDPLAILLEKASVDPKKELSQLITEHKYEEAFTIALQRSDVAIVSWLCSQVDIPGILTTDPVVLSQGVLLSLLQQLACDISNRTSEKLGWMRDILAAINPTDPVVIIHVQPILEQVNQILNHHRSLPSTTSVELSSIRLIMHVLNSMLMTSK
ncbi:enhancer of mRNA-decapping protein 4-like isoform X2 [Andrographis paniculata]|uniref:enhancer of mRNA-decapping protein 4-like isoform X2 n=1 Tax=Andrographis paniculata TaxID=175694 RepID=UPI0021E7D40E|nr:enhancer of mRNA-decapping protein 4-like isoform X2 [Andrographis paniculata]